MTPDLVHHWAGYAALAVFIGAYALVVAEEVLHLKKSKPVILAAGIIWALAAYVYGIDGKAHDATHAAKHNMLEYAELLLFLLAAMTYVNTLDERNVFQALRARLVSSGMSLRAIYWVTGIIAFFLSPVADNLTTALVMGAVVVAVGAGYPAFVAVGCINIVIAANSGGAFSPFGDITTLMVWQKGVVEFGEFFALFIPSVVSWIVPAFFMSLSVPKDKPQAVSETVAVKRGGFVIIALFLATIAGTVLLHHTLHLPPFMGMMTGLGVLMLYGHVVRARELKGWAPAVVPREGYKLAEKPFDIFISAKRVEWDTLLFFYGVVMCVGGLGAFGYLQVLSGYFYEDLGPTVANTLIGLLSAIVDNIPIMFAVLSMNPEMSHNQWLLVTLTAGIGGSLLSVGSAAGVALMGQAKGVYTFFSHLKWTWAIALGYALAIAAHLWINGV